MADNKNNPTIDVTIRATNGTPWQTNEFHSESRVDHVRRAAIKHFVDDHVMTDGDYALALVKDDQAEPLVDSGDLDESGVTDGSVLVLTVRGHQVDG